MSLSVPSALAFVPVFAVPPIADAAGFVEGPLFLGVNDVTVAATDFLLIWIGICVAVFDECWATTARMSCNGTVAPASSCIRVIAPDTETLVRDTVYTRETIIITPLIRVEDRCESRSLTSSKDRSCRDFLPNP